MNLILYISSTELHCPICYSERLQYDDFRRETYCKDCGCVCADQSLPTLKQMQMQYHFEQKFKEKIFIENEDAETTM